MPHPPRGVAMDVASLCHEFVSGAAAPEAARELAKGIRSGSTGLLTIVQELGVYLTSTSVENRSRGTRLLSEILSSLHSHSLHHDEVHYLVQFYCDRLKDRAMVLPAVLLGLQALASHQKLQAADVVIVSRAIFREVHTQSLQQSERAVVYSTLGTFLQSYLEALQEMGSDFVLGYIQAVDGERDPRNLLSIFSTLPTLIHHLPFEVLAEDLFEVISCYFPIDFSPPPNDPHAISREQLTLGLRRCLTATPQFAEFCLPLLLEKLSSDLQSAKVDSLLTLAMGAEVYGASELRPFLEPLWMALRREVFQSMSEEVVEAGLQAATAMAHAVSSPLLHPGQGQDDLTTLATLIFRDCQRHLRGSELMRPAARVLLALARASDQACTLVTSSTLPLLLSQLSQETPVVHRRALLDVLLDFISVSGQTSLREEASYPHSDSILSVVFSALGDNAVTIRVVAIAIISRLLQLGGFLSNEKVGLCAEHLVRMALSDTDASIRAESASALGVMGRRYSQVVVEEILPKLVESLTGPNTTSSTLHLLSSLSTHPTITSSTLPVLLSLLSTLSTSPPSPHVLDLARAASHSLRTAIERAITSETSNPELSQGTMALLTDSLIAGLVGMCVGPTLASPAPLSHVMGDESVLGDISAVLRSYTQALDPRSSQSLAELGVCVFLRGSVEEVGLASQEQQFAPLESSSPPCQTQLVALLTAIVGSLPSEVVAPYSPTLLPPLLHLSTHSTHPPSREHAAKAYASILNKMQEGPELSVALDRDMRLLSSQLSSDCDVERQLALGVWLWVTKALVMRSHPHSREATIKLLSLLGDPSLQSQAADGFLLILTDCSDILCRASHAIIRLMYKQQFFTVVVPEIIQQFHQAKPSKQQYLLRALSHTMQGVPRQVLLGDLPTLLPLLLESLRCEGEESEGVRVSTLEGLCALVHDAPAAISGHVTSMVPRLLELSRPPHSMKVRIATLRCVGALTSLPLHVVLPFKSEVIWRLGVCLDDTKRLVRKEAVRSRSDWFMLGAV